MRTTKPPTRCCSPFKEFDPRFAKLAERVFAEDHLDAEVRKGKRGGAFCATVGPDLTPWVLLNYQGKADDVATMAHELGHAIHSMLAEKHTLFTQHACLPLAETASTFGEMMLVDRLLAEETDEAVKRDLLFRQVDDAYATIQRQAFFAMFEKEAHQMIVDGASVDELSEAYLKNLKAQFGSAVEVSDEFKWEWVSIPHIYQVPFYVYAYAFGQLLVLSLYKRYKEEGEAFKPKYINLLSAGGSEAPMKLLAEDRRGCAQGRIPFRYLSNCFKENQMNPQEQTPELLDFFRALADENRLKIVGLLAQKPSSVSDLAKALGLSVSTTSNHLSSLAYAGLVKAQPDGHYFIYSLQMETIRNMAKHLLQEENLPRLSEGQGEDAFERKVLNTFLNREGRIKVFPAQEKKFLSCCCVTL